MPVADFKLRHYWAAGLLVHETPYILVQGALEFHHKFNDFHVLNGKAMERSVEQSQLVLDSDNLPLSIRRPSLLPPSEDSHRHTAEQ